MSNPYDYIDPSKCCSAKSLFNATEHNRLTQTMERKERTEDIQTAVASMMSQQKKAANYRVVSKEAEQLLNEIIVHECDGDYWPNRFDGLSIRDDTILRGTFGELQSAGLIKTMWADDVPYYITILKDGYLYEKHMEEMHPMSNFEMKLKELLDRSRMISLQLNCASLSPVNKVVKHSCEVWMDEVQIFYSNYLTGHPLAQRMNSLLFHRSEDAFDNLVSCLESISKDQTFIDMVNGSTTMPVSSHQAKTIPEYDVFISHANADKENLIDELNESLKRLGVKIFYDKEELEWGDNWKDRILNGTEKAEFAIIVISENFFDREWTERELSEFLNRQNRNGQKLILPILHNITVQQLKDKYPMVADIQAIDSSKYTCDQIALLFARQLIKRLKSE